MSRDLKGQEACWNRDVLRNEILQRVIAEEVVETSKPVLPACSESSGTAFPGGVSDFLCSTAVITAA